MADQAVTRVRVRTGQPDKGADTASTIAAPTTRVRTRPNPPVASREPTDRIDATPVHNVGVDVAANGASRFRSGNVDENGDYIVGRNRPPPWGQTKPGEVRSPGRPKGSKNNRTLATQVLNRKISVRKNGKLKTMTVRDAAMMAHGNKSVAGDLKSLEFLLKTEGSLDIHVIGDVGPAENAPLIASDQEILDFMKGTIRDSIRSELEAKQAEPSAREKQRRKS